jgi:hypothetical protein
VEAHSLRATVLALVLLLITGCGAGGGDKAATTANTSGTAEKDRAAVVQTVTDIYEAFTQAEGARLCKLMAPEPRRELLAIISATFPKLKNKSCGAAVLGFYRQVPPSRTPRAIRQAEDIAGDLSYEKIRVDGDKATMRFPDGGTWDLKRTGNSWLVSRFPMLPEGSLGAGDSPPPALS